MTTFVASTTPGPREPVGDRNLVVMPASLSRWVCYGSPTVATVIVSDETIKNLIEAHASMAAWYYQMSDALRTAGATATPPSDAQRQAYVAQIGHHYPELSAVAAQVTAPRPFIPPPAIPAPAVVMENEGITVSAPPKDHIASPEFVPGPAPAPAPAAPAPVATDAAAAAHDGDDPPKSSAVPPPPPMIVDPTKVKYEE